MTHTQKDDCKKKTDDVISHSAKENETEVCMHTTNVVLPLWNSDFLNSRWFLTLGMGHCG